MLVPILKLWLASVIAYVLYSAISDFSKLGVLGLALSLGACALSFLMISDWKSVRLEGDRLLISALVKRIVVPVTEVAAVEPSKWWGSRLQTITLYLKSPSEFGTKIVFVPRLGGFEAIEITEQLRELIASQR